jgi:hypothetical protein
MSMTFEIKGDAELLHKLERFHPQVIPDLTRGVAEELRDKIAKEPGPVSRPIQWASRKQKIWYIAARRAAGLGPYVRNSDPWSQRLGPSWATANRGIDAVVGTHVTYAPWVQSEAKQQPMHKATGWVTDEQAIEEVQKSKAAERIMEEVLSKW